MIKNNFQLANKTELKSEKIKLFITVEKIYFELN